MTTQSMMTNGHPTDDMERGGHITLSPDLVLPAQLLQARGGSELQPEKRLMLAVLEDAVAVILRFAGSDRTNDRREVADAFAWVENDDLRWPYSFRNICMALGFDPGALRRGLTEWQALSRAGKTPAVGLSPFRRVSGIRHRANGRAAGIKRDAA